MLVGEQGGGYQDHYLLAAGDGGKGGAHGHFGFTETDITTDQSVHRLRTEQIAAHGVDGLELVGGFFEGELAAKLAVVFFIVVTGKAFARCSASVNIEQFSGGIAICLSGFLFALIHLSVPSLCRGAMD